VFTRDSEDFAIKKRGIFDGKAGFGTQKERSLPIISRKTPKTLFCAI
jgi:hypothetical protein